MGVVPINLPTFLSCYAMMYFSCRLPQCHSPSPPIVTSCSAPQQHDPFVVVLFHRSRTSCTAPPGCNDRPLLRIVSGRSGVFLVSAAEEEVRLPRRPTKRRRRKRRYHRPYAEISSVPT